jgi:hypothetical protein
MSTEHTAANQNQPAEIINPQSQAAINAMIKESVSEAVKSIFAGLQPVLASMALDPKKLGEALREANRPQLSPEDIARKLRDERESLKSKEDEAENRRMTAERQANCRHLDKNSHSSLQLCHNHPDHRPRAICALCHVWVHPAEWRIAATIEEASKYKVSKGKAYICEPHPCYSTVLQLESMS